MHVAHPLVQNATGIAAAHGIREVAMHVDRQSVGLGGAIIDRISIRGTVVQDVMPVVEPWVPAVVSARTPGRGRWRLDPAVDKLKLRGAQRFVTNLLVHDYSQLADNVSEVTQETYLIGFNP